MLWLGGTSSKKVNPDRGGDENFLGRVDEGGGRKDGPHRAMNTFFQETG